MRRVSRAGSTIGPHRREVGGAPKYELFQPGKSPAIAKDPATGRRALELGGQEGATVDYYAAAGWEAILEGGEVASGGLSADLRVRPAPPHQTAAQAGAGVGARGLDAVGAAGQDEEAGGYVEVADIDLDGAEGPIARAPGADAGGHQGQPSLRGLPPRPPQPACMHAPR